MSAGIDYGLGATNIDKDTGIRYGVIHHAQVGQAWYEESVPYYGPPTCPECGSEELGEPYTDGDRSPFRVQCQTCDAVSLEAHTEPEEPLAHTYDGGEYTIEQSAESTDLFILRSPYYTLCRFCSPCAPGAGYLLSQDEDGIRAYCLGPDWFEDEQPPYTVYSVATNELVYRPEA